MMHFLHMKATQNEIRGLIDAIHVNSKAQTGVSLGGNHYIFLSGEPNVRLLLSGRSGQPGLVAEYTMRGKNSIS